MDRDKSIIAQNAGTTAATIYNALAGDSNGVFNKTLYDDIRQHIFEGTLELAGAATVVSVMEAADEAPAQRPSFPRSNQSSYPSGGGDDAGTVVIKSGKHADKTIAQAVSEDPSWAEWASENLKNDFLRNKLNKYLAAA